MAAAERGLLLASSEAQAGRAGAERGLRLPTDSQQEPDQKSQRAGAGGEERPGGAGPQPRSGAVSLRGNPNSGGPGSGTLGWCRALLGEGVVRPDRAAPGLALVPRKGWADILAKWCLCRGLGLCHSGVIPIQWSLDREPSGGAEHYCVKAKYDQNRKQWVAEAVACQVASSRRWQGQKWPAQTKAVVRSSGLRSGAAQQKVQEQGGKWSAQWRHRRSTACAEVVASTRLS